MHCNTMLLDGSLMDWPQYDTLKKTAERRLKLKARRMWP